MKDLPHGSTPDEPLPTAGVANGSWGVRVGLGDDPDRMRGGLRGRSMTGRLWRREREADLRQGLRTPLVGIVADAKLLTGRDLGPLESRQVAAVHRIEANARRLHALTEDLLLLSAFDGRSAATQPEEVPIAGAVRDALDGLRGRLAVRDLELVEQITHAGLSVAGDRELLTRAMRHLLRDAIRVTPDGGRISVSVTRDGDAGRVVVHHSGPVRAVFRRQESLHEGLSVVRAIVSAHDGSVVLRSLGGSGGRVTITLPLVRARG